MRIFTICVASICFLFVGSAYAADVELSPTEIELKKKAAVFAAETCKSADCGFIESKTGNSMRTNPAPLIAYGTKLAGFGKWTAENSSINIMIVKDLENLRRILDAYRSAKFKFAGIWAMSPIDQPNEACNAIQMFRQKSLVRGATFYQPNALNLDEAIRPGLECQVDGVTVRGIETNEFLRYLFGVMREVIEGSQPPATVAEHITRLKKYTTDISPFWRQQGH